MGWMFLCPGCGKMLSIDVLGNSTPTAEVKLVNGNFCGNCGRDLTSSRLNAIQAISRVEEERRRQEQQKNTKINE